jgi:hypothetical protein
MVRCSARSLTFRILVVVATVVLLLLALALFRPSPIQASCVPEPESQWAPAGFVCEPRFGIGWASRYDGQWAAMNFCSFELRATQGCGEVEITSLQTGRSVVTPVREWCHCYVNAPGPNGETARLVDLTRSLVSALGLNWNDGMYRVRVEPVSVLPDTATSVK